MWAKRFLGRLAFSLVLLLILCAPAHSQIIEEVELADSVNWQEGVLDLELTVHLSQEQTFLPSVRFKVEKEIRSNLAVYLQEALGDLNLTSYRKVREEAGENPRLNQAIYELAGKSIKGSSYLNQDMTEFIINYRFKLFPDIISLFIDHTRAYSPPKILTYEPTNEFSGVVIYVKGSFPVHGTDASHQLQPCLFPQIYDQQMRLVLDEGMMEPQVLQKWGVMAYTDTLDEKPFIERIGHTPLRIMATGLFGKYHTDIMIPIDSARKLLYNEHNRDLLTAGKILVICDLPEAP
jgi:hypothetical protein